MENNIIQQIREELGGFRDEIRSDLKTVNDSLRGLCSDVDTNTKELRAIRQEFRSDINTNIKDIRTFRNSVTKGFEAIRERDADLRNALDHEFKSVDDRFKDVHRRFDEMKSEFARIQAIGQNGRLSNPFLPIHALPIYLPNQGITYPEATHFPKNANEFYALKQPTSQRQAAMLAYLAMFYDVSNYKKHGDIAIHDPEETLGYLENILGLEEERFIRFKERAYELNQEPKVAPIKRSQIADVERLFPHKRQRSRHSSDPESNFTYGPEDKLGWRHKSLSNPTEAEPTIGGLAKKHRDWKRAQDAANLSDDSSEDEALEKPTGGQEASKDSGTTTNVNTSRDAESEQEQLPIIPRRV
ncbi:hypothetical protein H9Q69_014177 [Fusarium xylarioides]|uniref:Uncharacterized protein n=1 Tax=Fusarium xylarioides TaxID=221167 RepID=A0A9P7I0V6_9HYPO|nr:hypothetical protein H9Q72_002047 [Fusarium xylarioides]KAG5786747.1 hypothetical protein H9Q69_014177 [Fusarium xylarioides]